MARDLIPAHAHTTKSTPNACLPSLHVRIDAGLCGRPVYPYLFTDFKLSHILHCMQVRYAVIPFTSGQTVLFLPRMCVQ